MVITVQMTQPMGSRGTGYQRIEGRQSSQTRPADPVGFFCDLMGYVNCLRRERHVLFDD